MKKRIGLFLGSEAHHGGKFQYTQSILNAVATLPSDRYEVVVVYVSTDWERYLCNYCVEKIRHIPGLGERIFDRYWRNCCLPIDWWRKLMSRRYSLGKTILGAACDLWIFPAEDTAVYQVPVRGICTIFDLMHRYESRFPEVSAFGRARRRDRHYKRVCRYAQGVLVDSNVGKKHVLDSYVIDDRRVYVLPYVVPPYVLNSESQSSNILHDQLPKKFIFYPAQFWKHKNHETLLRAIHALKVELPDLKVVFVGSKKNGYNQVLELCEKLQLISHICMLGYVSDDVVVEIYKRARALVMPTFFGPTNIPPLEAFELGCPVAISNIYAMPEQVGDAALLFDPLSVDDIAKSIRMLWCDDELCSMLRQKGCERAAHWRQEHFNQCFEVIVSNVIWGDKNVDDI